MRIFRPIVAAAMVCASAWLAPVAVAEPAVEQTMVATITDDETREHSVHCYSEPGPCTLRRGGALLFTIRVSNFSGSPITFDFEVDGITATPGQDYVPWPHASPDTVTTDSNGTARVRLDTVIDSVAEPAETVRLRLTGASRPVNISDTGTGTIRNGSQLPAGCSATRINEATASMTCTGRPAGQQWRSRFECGGFPPPWAPGNIVTGNGTSTATCPVHEPWLTGDIRFVTV